MRTSPAAVVFAGLLLGPALGRAEPPPPPPVVSVAEINQLVQDLGDSHFAVRQRASKRLQAIGLDALPALQMATETSDPEVRQRAWQLIDAWAAEGKVPALLFQLSGGNSSVRAAAADNLGKLGAGAKRAIPALALASQDKSDLVRCCAREAMKNIQSTPEVTVEVACLDPDVKVGGNQRFNIQVSNTGTAAATNLRFEVVLPGHLTPVNGLGVDYRRDGQRIITVPMELTPNSQFRLELCCKVTRKGAEAVQVEVRADQLPTALRGADNLPPQTATGQPRPTPQSIIPAFAQPIAMPQAPPPPVPQK